MAHCLGKGTAVRRLYVKDRAFDIYIVRDMQIKIVLVTHKDRGSVGKRSVGSI